MLVDEHGHATVVRLLAERLREHRHRPSRASEPEYQGNDSELRGRDVIERGQALFAEPLLRYLAADAVTHTATVGAEMAHHPQASDAAAGISAKIDHEAIAFQIGYRATDVAGNVHAQDAGKHAHSDHAGTIRQLGRVHDLVRNHNRALLLF